MKKTKIKIHKESAAEIKNPDFENSGRVHDWRNYVLPELREIWDSLNFESKVIIFYLTSQMAHDEEWD